MKNILKTCYYVLLNQNDIEYETETVPKNTIIIIWYCYSLHYINKWTVFTLWELPVEVWEKSELLVHKTFVSVFVRGSDRYSTNDYRCSRSTFQIFQFSNAFQRNRHINICCVRINVENLNVRRLIFCLPLSTIHWSDDCYNSKLCSLLGICICDFSLFFI